MKTFAILASLAATALAQNAGVTLPGGSKLTAGSKVVVQVQRPNSLTGSTEIGIAIGIQSCPNSPCTSTDSSLGTLLYHGSFNPQYHEGSNPPYENFTVTVPDFDTGKAVVGVAHAAIVGVSPLSSPYIIPSDTLRRRPGLTSRLSTPLRLLFKFRIIGIVMEGGISFVPHSAVIF
ncbi:hypothetical protein BJX99DRAFT_232319 [Aspergillus californicus]